MGASSSHPHAPWRCRRGATQEQGTRGPLSSHPAPTRSLSNQRIPPRPSSRSPLSINFPRTTEQANASFWGFSICEMRMRSKRWGRENLFKKGINLSGPGLSITIHPLSQTQILNTSTSRSKLSWQQSHSPEVPPRSFVGASQFQGGFSANSRARLIRKENTMRSPSLSS